MCTARSRLSKKEIKWLSLPGDESFADALSHVSCGVQLAARQDARDCGEAYPIGSAISDQDLINRHHFQLMAAHYWEETSGMEEEL
jgi:hypothetical protein